MALPTGFPPGPAAAGQVPGRAGEELFSNLPSTNPGRKGGQRSLHPNRDDPRSPAEVLHLHRLSPEVEEQAAAHGVCAGDPHKALAVGHRECATSLNGDRLPSAGRRQLAGGRTEPRDSARADPRLIPALPHSAAAGSTLVCSTAGCCCCGQQPPPDAAALARGRPVLGHLLIGGAGPGGKRPGSCIGSSG